MPGPGRAPRTPAKTAPARAATATRIAAPAGPATDTGVDADIHRPAVPLTAADRVVLLSHGFWGNACRAKTGLQVLRWSPAHVIAVVDPDQAGGDAVAVAGPRAAGGRKQDHAVPIVASWADAEAVAGDTPPTHAVVGIAPPGGALPPAMRTDLLAAARSGVHLVAGLHMFLANDPELATAAAGAGGRIVDLRKPPEPPVMLTGRARTNPVAVVAMCGTDCSSGKMTVALALARAAAAHGVKSAFVATGQTGLLLGADAGAPIDRCISDFAAGEVERQTLAACRLDPDGRRSDDSPDIVFVEGQGALTHPAFSGVTAAILHGAHPDAVVLCHMQGRIHRSIDAVGEPWTVTRPEVERDLVDHFMRAHTGARIAAFSVATPDTPDDERHSIITDHTRSLGLPTADPMRPGGTEHLLAGIVAELAARAPNKTTDALHALARRLH